MKTPEKKRKEREMIVDNITKQKIMPNLIGSEEYVDYDQRGEKSVDQRELLTSPYKWVTRYPHWCSN